LMRRRVSIFVRFTFQRRRYVVALLPGIASRAFVNIPLGYFFE
jgi:hypothetical protein